MRITALIFAILLSTSAARATPPQVVSVDETLLAIGGSFLFIERVMSDNMGSHTRVQTDVVLIARSIKTNQDMYLWPLKRTLDHGPDHAETADNPRVVTLPLDWDYHALQIVSIHHGRHPNQRKANDGDAVEVLQNKDGVLITIKTPDFAYETPKGTPPRTSYWLSHTKLAELVHYSLRNARYDFPPHFVEGEDPLINPKFNPEHDCKIDYLAELSEQTDGPQQGFWAAKINCENDYTMAPVSMFITLQPLP